MKRWVLHALIGLFLISSISVSQTIDTPRFEGAVYDDNGKPVKSIVVEVSGAKNKVVTDSRGRFTAEFELLEPGTPITISIGTEDWIVYSPVLGKHVIQNKGSREIFTVQIARRGSSTLYSREVLAGLAIEQQNQALSYQGKYYSLEEQEQSLEEQKQKKEDVIIKYSKLTQIDLNFLRNRIAQLSTTKETDSQKTNVDVYRANAAIEYQKGNLPEAIKQSEAAAAIAKADFDNSKNESAKKLRVLIENYKLTAGLFSESRDYINALKRYELLGSLLLEESASGEVSKEDALDAKFWIATTKMQLGNIVEGQDAIKYLIESKEEYEQLLSFYDAGPLRQQWASIKINLAGVLIRLADKSAKDSRTYLDASKRALEDAIEIFKDTDQEQLARAKNNLSITLFELGNITGGQAGMDYLGNSKNTIMEALDIYAGTRPLQWSLAKNTLGNTLRVLGQRTQRTNDQAGIEILKDSRQAYKDALTVLPERSFSWARANGSLGITLQILGENPESDPTYLKDSKEALDKALTVFTRNRYAQPWAKTMITLGGTLGLLGERTKGSEGLELLKTSADIFNNISDFYKDIPFSRDWGNAQNNLGVTFQKMGQRTDGAERIGYLEKSKDYLQTALTVFTKEKSAHSYSTINDDLGLTFQLLSGSLEGEKSRAYMIDAAKAYLEASTESKDHSSILKAFDIYHNKLFLFDKSLSASEDWLTKNKNDMEVQVRFAENLLTTNQPTECDKKADLLAKDISTEKNIVLKTIQIVCLLENRQSKKVAPSLDSMEQISAQSSNFKVSWNSDGTKYFINQNRELKRYRKWLLTLISVISNNDRDTILQGLKTVRKDFKD